MYIVLCYKGQDPKNMSTLEVHKKKKVRQNAQSPLQKSGMATLKLSKPHSGWQNDLNLISHSK